ncbi:MAG TPA: alpha/beta hydrolase [Coleofasciculaceae cyanobacterium]
MGSPSDRELELTSEPSALMEQPIQAVMPDSHAIQHLENALKDIYFVSGLGADERVFRLLKFDGYQPVHIHWLAPQRGEPIAEYAKRLAAQIKSERPTIVGLSFGGMIAVEIAKHMEVEQVILISSAKTKFEIPFYFKLFRYLPIHRIFPFKSLLWAEYRLGYWLFSVQSPDERQLLRSILQDTDAHFLKWALHQVVTWGNELIPDNLCHLHGSSDRVFPIRFVTPDLTVEQGGHLMILNRAAQVSTLLGQIISPSSLPPVYR